LNAVIVDGKDNVATALSQLEKGDSVKLEFEDLSYIVNLSETIPAGHKFALKAILKMEPVVKYGENIGLATRNITAGQLVHIHNVEGLKGRGDKK
jgi:altronate dehydratase small subunit